MPTTGPSIRRAAPAPPFDIGETVAQRYRVESLLSEDALGYTYTVSEANHALRVLRLLRARMGTLGVKLPDEALSTWRSQLEKARDFRHANIPTIEEMCFGDEHGRVFLVRTAIELEGQPLSALLSARPTGLSEAEAVRLLAGIAEVVEAAHQHGILHLSLSPSRIFVVPSGESIAVRVADFALLPPALAPQFGEAGYLTPEQVEGQPCDRRSDQFALAVILYEMLSSQPAFIGAPDEDRQVTLSRVQHEDPLPLALSRPLEQALARALSRSRAVRFPNLHDFVRALGIDGVAWSLVFPPGSSKSPPLRPVRQALWQPVLLGAAVASLAIFAIWGVASRLGSSTSSPAQATDGSVDVGPGGPGNPGLLSPTVSSGRADAAGELAFLERHERAEILLVAAQGLAEAPDCFTAPRRRYGAPHRGGLDRAPHDVLVVGGRGAAHARERRAGSGVRHIDPLAGARRQRGTVEAEPCQQRADLPGVHRAASVHRPALPALRWRPVLPATTTCDEISLVPPGA
jgi:serine/threonine-protein kinase